MNAIRLQAGRIIRCYRFISRHNPEVDLELIAREWITRYARQWRQRLDRSSGDNDH